MFNKIVIVMLAVLFLVVPSAAKAALPPSYPDQVTGAVPAPDLAPDLAQAKVYWENRGLNWKCDGSDVWWADSVHNPNPQNGSDELDAVGSVTGCTIVLRKLRYPQMTPWTDQERFSLVVHEMGHNLGLQHNDPRFPVMSGDYFILVSPEPAVVTDTIQPTKVAAKKLSHKKHKHHRKHKKARRHRKHRKHN